MNNAKKRLLQAIMNLESKKCKEHYEPIYFTMEDFGDIEREHDDLMVILTLIHNFLIKQVLIDQGSLTDILSHAAKALGMLKGLYKPYNNILVSFSEGQVQVEGTINLQLTLDS